VADGRVEEVLVEERPSGRRRPVADGRVEGVLVEERPFRAA